MLFSRRIPWLPAIFSVVNKSYFVRLQILLYFYVSSLSCKIYDCRNVLEAK
jgi:hypothetical protein